MTTLIEAPVEQADLKRKAQEISKLLAENLPVEMSPVEVYARMPEDWRRMTNEQIVWRLTGYDLKIDGEVVREIGE